MAILDLKKVTYRRIKLKRLVYYLFNGFTEKLKQSYNLLHMFRMHAVIQTRMQTIHQYDRQLQRT